VWNLSLTLWEDHRARVFENNELMRIFEPKTDEGIGEWGKLLNVELNDLYSSPKLFRVIKSRRMRWDGSCSTYGERRGLYRVFVGKPEGKKTFGRLSHRWEDNIKMFLQKVVCDGMDWLELAQDSDR